MNLSTLLQTIVKEYNFHVYHTLPVENGYLFETNVGPKHISIWRDEELLQWSFSWREELAKKGFRQIDRFIRSRDGAPFVQVNKEYIVVQDRFEDKGIAGQPLTRWEMVGRLTGLMLKTCKELSFAAESRQTDIFRPKAEMNDLFTTKDQIDSLKKEVFAQDNMFTYIVQVHWKEIEKRWKHATAIRRLSSNADRDVLFPVLRLSQWTLLEQGFLGFSCHHQQANSDLRDIAHCLKELYISGDESNQALDQFYNGFEMEYQPLLEEHYSILANFVYPQSFFTIIHKYLRQGYTEEECVKLWMDECEVQQSLDRLHLWHAERIDRLREESVSL